MKVDAAMRCMAIAALSIAASPAFAQGEPPATAAELAVYCERVPCRRDAVIQVRLADGRVQEERSILHRPAVTSGSLSVLLGEELRAVPQFDDDAFAGWRAAERRESVRAQVLTFKAEQSASDGSVSLGISNSGREPVKLRLFIREAGQASGEYSSSCPVLAGGTVYEYWAQPVVEVIVREATLLTDDAALLCD